MNYQIHHETFIEIGLWGGGEVIFQSLIFSHEANVRKIHFFIFLKNCPHQYFLYFYSDIGTLWSTTGTNFSQVY